MVGLRNYKILSDCYHIEARIKTFGQGTGDPYLSVVTCNGNETRLLDCENVGPGRCEDRIAAGVMCKGDIHVYNYSDNF